MTIRSILVLGLLAGAAVSAEPEAEQAPHWAYQPLNTLAPSGLPDPGRTRNPIDHFVTHRLERLRIAPAPVADRSTLIRRVTLDLTGLLPEPADVARFLADRRPGAWERVVDRLLASPHYGEHFAREWMDLTHYADSDGYLTDQLRPVAWRFRQWLVGQLNADTPFDLLTLRQLAGDLLPKATLEDRLGTGFLRQTLSNREGGADPEEFRVKQIVDRTETVAAVWLGLTIGCARCHDHKYDQLSQREFFGLYAFLNTADEVNLYAPLPGQSEPYESALATYNKQRDELLKPLGDKLAVLQARWEARLLEAAARPGRDFRWDRRWEVLGLVWGGQLGEGQLEGWEIVKRDVHLRTRDEKDRLLLYFLGQGELIDPAQFKSLKLGELKNKLVALRSKVPWPTRAPAMREARIPRQAFVQVRGDFRVRGESVDATPPAVLPTLSASGTRDRLSLARWLVSDRHPLTSRVVVNRMWQHFFGTGLVRSSDDFGIRGERPSHPRLLDWLSSEFRDRGWSVKRMHRLIVTSATYRQSSIHRRELETTDPGNRLLARQLSKRVSAEVIRDTALQVSGLLSRHLGGPSVRPPQPESVTSEAYGNSWVTSTGVDRYRRAIYTFIQRTTPFAQGKTFDAPSPGKTCTHRERSNTPLQALTLLNDPVFVECAQSLAAGMLEQSPAEDTARLQWLMRRCLCREGTEMELERLRAHLASQRQIFSNGEAAESAGRVAGAASRHAAPDEAAAWVVIASVFMNLHEFITRD
ncbi:MAG: DUF1549 and DUF1553 domain-containing protein [Planctomycetota bacterium]|nr:DUF1549 and DUF1553 domain-containing protein [Planctomycetota bacterium]